MQRRLLLIALCLCTTKNLFVTPILFLRPYDYVFVPHKWPEQKGSTLNVGFAGFSPHGCDSNGNRVNPFQVSSPTQNALAMLKGFPLNTVQGQTAQAINIDDDDGIRGHFDVTGNFRVGMNYAVALRYNITKDWALEAFLPFYTVTTSAITWNNKTESITADDMLIKQLITDNFAENVFLWGDGLTLDGWNKSGQGDLLARFYWSHTHLQYKQYIKKVKTSATAGIFFPTGVQTDVNKPLFMPFGFDGAYALTYGFCLEVNFSYKINLGIVASFTQIAMTTKERRIKTDINQTDLLLLKKGLIMRDHGSQQVFELYIEPIFNDYLSLRIFYDYSRFFIDNIYSPLNDFSYDVANFDPIGTDATAHNIVTQLRIDLATEENQRYMPQITAFWKHPFNGNRSIQMNYIGLGFELTF